MPRATAKPKLDVTTLSAEERAELLAELTATPADEVSMRELTPRERLVASLMRDRDHLDGCPAYRDERGGIRTEAYDELKPAIPSKGIPARPVAVLRCVECSGTRYFEDTNVKAVLLAELSSSGEEVDLDGSI
jgi:hypothetical protein